MATVSQLKTQLSAGVQYAGGEAIAPPPPAEEPQPMLIIQEGLQAEGTDYGVVKVENGKLVLDMADFNPDFGIYYPRSSGGGGSSSRS